MVYNIGMKIIIVTHAPAQQTNLLLEWYSSLPCAFSKFAEKIKVFEIPSKQIRNKHIIVVYGDRALVEE